MLKDRWKNIYCKRSSEFPEMWYICNTFSCAIWKALRKCVALLNFVRIYVAIYFPIARFFKKKLLTIDTYPLDAETIRR